MMRKVSSAGFLILVFLWAAPIVCFADEWTVTAEGYGPVHTGMTIEQAEKLLHSPLVTSEGAKLNPSCDYVHPEHGHDRVEFMVMHGKIAHVAIANKAIKTETGISVGDSPARIVSIYGPKIEKQMDPYGGANDYYYFIWKNPGSGIKFVIMEGKVHSINAGDSTIRLVEGCS
jgi:hypothetical protein